MVKSFEGRPVLDGVSLEILRGEFFSLLGPSGVGKTTLLRLCAGFDHPDSGEIEIDGRAMVGVPPNARPVNTVFQAYALFPHLTVERNVGFGLDMRGVSRSERDRRVTEALALLHMEPLRRRTPAQLSGGEQQRVAIARAVINRPAVVLLDEPMAALDEPLRQAMLEEMKTIQRRIGTTFLCVTHHQEEALGVSDRVAVMRAGRIVQVGSPQEIYERPASRFVAEFLGRSNMLTGIVVQGRDRVPALSVEGCAAPVRLPFSGQGSLAVGSRVTLAVRAECVGITDLPPSTEGETATLRARIESLRYAGAVWHCTLLVSGQGRWHATIPNHGRGEVAAMPGREVSVSWSVHQSTVVAEDAG